MALNVVVINATDLPNVETLGNIDPYLTIDFQGFHKKTKVIKGELNPSWNESFEFDLKGLNITPKDELTITVKDWERIGRNNRSVDQNMWELTPNALDFRDFQHAC